MPNAPDRAELEAAIYRHLSLQPAHEMPEALIVKVAELERVAAGEPVRAELAVGHAVADDVVVGNEDVVPRGADCLRFAAATADLPVVGGEGGGLAARNRLRRFGQRRPQPLRPRSALAPSALSS